MGGKGGDDGKGGKPSTPKPPTNMCNLKQFVEFFGRDAMMERSSHRYENVSATSLVSEDLDFALAGKCSQ
jgi:hypothetical protein